MLRRPSGGSQPAWGVGVREVRVVDVDVVGAEPAQAVFDLVDDVPARQPSCRVEPTFTRVGPDHNVVASADEGAADDLLGGFPFNGWWRAGQRRGREEIPFGSVDRNGHLVDCLGVRHHHRLRPQVGATDCGGRGREDCADCERDLEAAVQRLERGRVGLPPVDQDETATRIARPRAPPIMKLVLTTPEARPASCGSTSPIAASRTGLNAIPAPRPSRTIAGRTWTTYSPPTGAKANSARLTATKPRPVARGTRMPIRITSRSDTRSEQNAITRQAGR